MKLNSKELNKILYFLLAGSLFVGLNFNEDFGGGGSILDFYNTFPKIENPIDNLFKYDTKFPLHYFLGSLIYAVLENQFLYRVFFLIIAIYLPLLFYNCLKIKFKNVGRNYLFFLSLILLILPGVRSAAIWPNTQLTSLLFFLFSIKYFLKWELTKENRINKNFYLFLFFMGLAVYCREIYAIIYFYFYIYFFFNFNFKEFLKASVLIFLLSLPGLIFISLSPSQSVLAMDFYTFNFQNTILINFSILFFYLTPFFLIYLAQHTYLLRFNKNYIVVFLIAFLITVFLSNKFDFDLKNGGGVILKISNLIFENNHLFYFSSFLGIVFVYAFAKNNLFNILLFFLLIIGISGKYIFMKYFEPMFIILFFLIFKNIEIENLFKKNNTLFYFAYFFIYLIGSLIFTVFNIKKFLFSI